LDFFSSLDSSSVPTLSCSLLVTSGLEVMIKSYEPIDDHSTSIQEEIGSAILVCPVCLAFSLSQAVTVGSFIMKGENH